MARESSTRFALLAMLSLQPMSGYDVKQFASGSIGHFWTESYGQIYPMLKQLARQGLVRRSAAKGGKGRDRQVYSLTPAGRTELRRWLAQPAEPQPPRSELLLKLFFGRQMTPAAAAAHLEQMRAEHASLLAHYRQVEAGLKKQHRAHPDLPFWLMTLHFGQMRSDSIAQWCERSLRDLARLPSAPHTARPPRQQRLSKPRTARKKRA